MFKFYFDKKPVVENSQRTSISVFIRHSYMQIEEQIKRIYQRELDLNDEADVRLFIEIIEKNVKINLKQENSDEASFTEMNSVKLTFTKSNLNKGFVFWFICNLCAKKVRYLYFPPNSEILACRNCHRLAYRKQNENRSRGWLGQY